MPLTIAHPAAVLPFRYSKLPLSALVVGSLVPDFEYALHLYPRSDFSHTALGLFMFCLPAGMIALWIFQRIWKPALVDKLDREHHHRIQPFAFKPFPRFALLCLAILIGAASNIAWNTFTHEYGWAVQNIDALRQTIGGSDLPLYVLLHHVSTLLGLAVLLFVAFYHRHWAWPSFVAHWPLLFVISWITVAGGIALGMLVAGDVSNVEGLKRWVNCGLVVGSLVTTLVTTFLCMIWQVRNREFNRRNS